VDPFRNDPACAVKNPLHDGIGSVIPSSNRPAAKARNELLVHGADVRKVFHPQYRVRNSNRPAEAVASAVLRPTIQGIRP
jgi:hypothetical protein